MDVQSLTLTLDGPVVHAIIEWSGVWQPAPLDPAIGVEVTGPNGTATGVFAGSESTDATGLPVTPAATAYGYVADITNLFSGNAPGTYTVNVTPPVDGIDGGENHWGGATITAIYNDSPCSVDSTTVWQTGVDYYYGGNSSSSPTTDLIIYDWGYPLLEDYTASFATSVTGMDYEASNCRASSIWVAAGSGTAPPTSADLVDDVGVPNPDLGGVEGITNPFSPPSQPCPPAASTAPVSFFIPGNVGPEQALVQFDMTIPAGSTWAAIQLESPSDNAGNPGSPDEGIWSGAGLLILPAFVPPEPDIALEKTILEGTDATCPGIEGSDEFVAGDFGTPITYCFTVTNTGEVPLKPVELSDPGLGITQDDMTLVSGDDSVDLKPGKKLVYSYSSTITASLVNTATATGHPIDNGAPVTASNDAEVQKYVISGTVTPFCEADAPYLGYDIRTTAPGTTATIKFAGNGGSETVTVPVGKDEILWPGASVGPDGVGADWPGWDQDADGSWFENPDNAYAWAQGNVTVTVTVNPSTDPVVVAYPPGTETCATAPQPADSSSGVPPAVDNPATSNNDALPLTGSADPIGPVGLATAMLLVGAALVLFSRRRTRRS
ncbi:hypothetical protein [Microbacterium sp. MPKO10]|uniref:DUF7507 domain-containing protein n=1 Tax=Microbacterium sp. MPKO10 TaxID=2989818 RepID=UPI0022357FFA|nr:hypothetical protein [Microbacterium sp. MPKO10]MCW4457280.1 hypothetical protein [Microbacterium sp. MPKO10]